MTEREIEAAARVISPSLWGPPMAYPKEIECDHDLEFEREIARSKARAVFDLLAASASRQGADRAGIVVSVEFQELAMRAGTRAILTVSDPEASWRGPFVFKCECLASPGSETGLWFKTAIRSLSPVPAHAGEAPGPVAWSYELANCYNKETERWDQWKAHVAFQKPCVPENSIRNLQPLYTSASRRGEPAPSQEHQPVGKDDSELG